jgi:hypothetical protein
VRGSESLIAENDRSYASGEEDGGSFPAELPRRDRGHVYRRASIGRRFPSLTAVSFHARSLASPARARLQNARVFVSLPTSARAQRRRLFLFTVVKYLVNASSSDLFQYWRRNYSACGAACEDARLRRK